MASRRRRTAEEAREAILDATQQLMVEQGPARIRLQEVAKAVGVSHPTVLHHFGSREGLVEAAIARTFESLYQVAVAAIVENTEQEAEVGALIERIHCALESSGHARALAWLALDGSQMPGSEFHLRGVIDAVHAARKVRCAELGFAEPERSESANAVLLATFTLLGHAVAGEQVYSHAGLAGTGASFRAWLGTLIQNRLEEEGKK